MSLNNIKSGLTILLPTYNGEKVIQKALQGILNQKFKMPLEVILVNNNSFDDTISKAREYWVNFIKTNIDFKIINELKPGKFNAQHLGILSASYNYVLICDDDNILDDTYCQKAYDILTKDDSIAALGGIGIPEFETSQPSWFELYKDFYAVGPQNIFSGDITNLKGCLYGAGMVIRRDVYLSLFDKGFQPLFASRSGRKLASGSEDTELCFVFRMMGYKIYYDADLVFTHFIEKRKLNKDYLKSLVISQSKSSIANLVYQKVMLKKTYFELWLKNFIDLFSIQYLKNVIFYVTNYKEMRIHSVNSLITHYMILTRPFSFYRKYRELNKWFGSLNSLP